MAVGVIVKYTKIVMFLRIKLFLTKIFTINTHTVGLLVIIAIAVSVTYSSAKIIHKNYGIQQQITILKQQNDLQAQININQKLKNQYYNTDAFLELAARRYFNKSSPGERVVLIPESIAKQHAAAPLGPPDKEVYTSSDPWFIKNWRAWADFLSGKPIANKID